MASDVRHVRMRILELTVLLRNRKTEFELQFYAICGFQRDQKT